MAGASSATTTFRVTMIRPTAPARLRASAERRRPRPDRGERGAAAARVGGTLRVPDPRVEPSVQEIDQEVRENEEESGHKYGGLHQRVVSLEDGGHGEPSHTGPGEDRLRDDGAAEKGSQLEPDDRDHGNQRVPQR